MAEEAAKLFPGHRFRSHPWPSAKVEELSDQDEVGLLLAKKTRVNNPIQELMIVNPRDFIAVSNVIWERNPCVPFPRGRSGRN